MEQLFNDLKKDGKNNVENLIKWMKDCNILDDAKETEAKVRGLFKECKDQNNVDFAKFKAIVEQLAKEQMKNFEDLSKILMEKGPGFLKQFKEGASQAKGTASEAVSTVQGVFKDAAGMASKAFGKK